GLNRNQSNAKENYCSSRRPRLERTPVSRCHRIGEVFGCRGSKTRAFGNPGSVAAAISKISAHLVALDSAAEGEHIPRLRAKNDVVDVHGAFNPARLVRTLEVTGELHAVLLDLNILRGNAAVGIVGVNDPFALDVMGRLLSSSLLRQRWAAPDKQQQKKRQEWR